MQELETPFEDAKLTPALPYTWSQELKTVSVNVPLPAGTRARDLTVVMNRNKLKVIHLSGGRL